MQNFGQIHETFKDILANGIVEGKEEYKKLFKSYVKVLKENDALRKQYEAFDIIENKTPVNKLDVTDVMRHASIVDECVSTLKDLDLKVVHKANKSLVSFLKKKGFALTEDYENKELHNHIHNLAFTKRTRKSIPSLLESRRFVTEYGKELSETKEVIEPYTNKYLGPAMIEKFNEKYVGKLSETERKTFKVIQSGNEKEKQELYKGTILECIDLINLKLNEECTIQEKDKYLQVKDKLLRFTYDPDKFVSEMSKIAYLKDTLN
jgi:hypothetical protein